MMSKRLPNRGPATASWRVVREGKYWLLIAATFWATGVFKGINLVTLLAYLMLVIWMLNFLGARRRLRRLRLHRWVEQPIFANTPIHITFEAASFTASFPLGVRLEDRGPDHSRTWFVPWGRERTSYRFQDTIRLPRRGWYEWQPPQATTGYPFGLVEGTLSAGAVERKLVFPQLGRLHLGRLRRFLGHAVSAAGRSRFRPRRNPAAQDEIHGVREFRSGDSPRWIHWRTTAHRGELMVREFEETPMDNLVLLLDPWVPQDLEGSENNARIEAVFEAAVSLTATICWDWSRQKGDRLVLGVADRTPVVLAGVTGMDFALSLLERLALQRKCAAPNTAALVDRLADTELPPASMLVVSTRTSSFLDSLVTRFRRPVAYVDVSALERYDFYEGPANHVV
jgi:uncharacterized protein (DUF58 family)